MTQKKVATVSFTKDEYVALVQALTMTEIVYALLGDMVDGKYKKQNKKLEDLLSHVLEHASDAGYSGELEKYGGRLSIPCESPTYERVGSDLDAFEEWSLYENLANKLAWRDFRKVHSQKEIDKMAEEHDGYMGAELNDFIQPYYDEFDEHDVNRLRIEQ